MRSTRQDARPKVRAAMELVCEEADKWSILIIRLAVSTAGVLLALSFVVHVLHDSLT